jgi:DNA-binding NtrC family response regulator
VDLRARVAEGRFREDLFHRLNVVPLHVPPLRERKDDIVHLAGIFLQQFAALYRRPAHHFTTRAESALETYPWPGNVRELQNLILTLVLFCDAPEVDVEHLRHLEAPATPGLPGVAPGATAVAPRLGPQVTPTGDSEGPPLASDPASRLRKALAGVIASALGSAGRARAPIGKWLSEDLVLAAERLSGGVSRRGAELLGLAETTYRRQLQSAAGRLAAGLAVRSPHWPAVAGVLEDLIRGRRDGSDVCQWAEACLLAEIDSAVPGDVRTAAALLGVTEPTLLRRKAQPTSRF